MVGNGQKIVAVAAVVCRHDGGRLLAVGTAGVHMQIAHERVAAAQILRDSEHGKLNQTFFMSKQADIILLLLIIRVRKAQAAVFVRRELEMLKAAEMRIITLCAVIERAERHFVAALGESGVQPHGLDGHRHFFTNRESLGKNIIIVQFSFQKNHFSFAKPDGISELKMS